MDQVPRAGLENVVEDLTPQLGAPLDTNSFQINHSKGADVASASALALGTDGNYFDVTGTTTINTIGTVGIGTIIGLHFDGVLTLTYHATNLILPTAVNIVTAAGDEALFIEYASGDWRCVSYTRASGLPLANDAVSAAAAITDNAIVRGDGGAEGVQESGITISDADEIAGATIDVDTNTISNAGNLEMLKIGTPQYSTMKKIQGTTHSAGLVAIVSGLAPITNNGDGTVSSNAGDGLVKATDSTVADLYSCEWATDASVSLTDNSINYICRSFVDTSTDPAVVVTTTKPTDKNTNILLATVYRSGTEVHITNEIAYFITDHITRITDRWQETEPFAHATGAILSETGTRNLASTAGVFFEGYNRFETEAQDTSTADSFEYFYRDGAGGWTTHEAAISSAVFSGAGLNDATSGGTFVGSHTVAVTVTIDATGTPDTFTWSYIGNDGATAVTTTGVAITGAAQNLIDGISVTFAATTGHTVNDEWTFSGTLSSQIDNTQYDDGTGTLATLGNSRYGVHWIFLDTHGHLAVLFGQDSYTLTDAEDAVTPASVPPEFEVHARLIGRVIIAKSSAAFLSIENNYGQQFQGSVATDHGGLAGLTDDDHTQYVLADGSRNVTGAQTFDDDVTVGGNINSAPLDYYTYDKTLQFTALTWLDTGISGTDLATGSYMMSVYANDSLVGGMYQETFSGIMSWWATATNDTSSDELVLHAAGHARNSKSIYLRTVHDLSSGTALLRLEMAHSETTSGTSVYTFKFRRLL